ncbi:hypothetical protein KGM_207839 [Danaus plexippus plexippus]|uniref:Uncharacterized protein n=1 Tax=Danaus plexippus plexippus TaxID=278856 RepID=A0A212ENA3_DANPL|nr:hypothetical protein KGM_207839 [Danaus plexippus plexippus]
MASLSLPRVLQLRKNSLDAEREQFEKFQMRNSEDVELVKEQSNYGFESSE